MILHFKGKRIYRPITSPIPIKEEINITMDFRQNPDVPNMIQGVADCDFNMIKAYIIAQGIRHFQVTFYPIDVRKDVADLKKAIDQAIR